MSWENELIRKFSEGEATPDELVKSGGDPYLLIKEKFPEYFRGGTGSIVWDKQLESNPPQYNSASKLIMTPDRRLDGINYRLKGRVMEVLETHPRWQVKLDTDRDKGGQAILILNTKGRLVRIIT